ncbi:hypothetical protein [Mesorhizobium sp. M0058]|uniref:hypothetical protein n=1 Tax=Mesorhizobium sp. M0058 TaxID=2956865 RepID=UPI00333AD91E
MARMTEERRKELLAQYVAGVPTAQIAKDFGVSESYPSQLAARFNLKRRAQHYPRDPEDTKARRRARSALLVEEVATPAKPAPMHVTSALEIRRLAAMGKGRTQIAALLRCPYRVVDAALEDA